VGRRVFLIIYCLSGAAALLYQVAWSRLLTLHMGHTVAAVGTVLAAFMGGLAGGAAVAGRVAPALSRLRALIWYARLEAAIAQCALLVPFGLSAVQPLLRAAYGDGAGEWFGMVRALSSLLLIALPAAAMGATLPLAVRWLVGRADRAARDAGLLYAVNTIGAAFGAGFTGFVLLPALGLRLTTIVGVTLNATAAAAAWRLSAASAPADSALVEARTASSPRTRRARPPERAEREAKERVSRPWLAAAVLGLSGFVALLYEVVWTRALALVLGPTTYAFSTMLVAFIVGIACGSAAASRIADRTDRPVLWLASTLMLAAVGAFASSLAVGEIPLAIAGIVSAPDATLNSVVARQALLVAALLLPMTLAFGAAFPFAVAVAARRTELVAADVARVYVVNTAGAIAGALAGSFLLVPLIGLQRSILLGGILLVGAGVLIAMIFTSRGAVRVGIAAAGLALAAAGFFLPPWNPLLISSGAYKYAIEAAGDLETSLEAGELLSYAEGAAGTVTVRRVAGTTSLAIDGKVDASNGADMLTQKLLAHVPLLLHPAPQDVAVIGLGSGVTVGAALQHPVTRVDVLEISPQVVVAASSFFRKENRDALSDPRTRLILGDGRTHLLLSNRTYDVIISEPSNPWMAGIAALFTREFLAAARARLAPGGVLCQWAHTYDISEEDLRSIVATFASVFPDGAMWLVGDGDLLLIGAQRPVVDMLPNVERAWQRPGVAADLAAVSVDGFGLLSLFVAGGPGLIEFGSGPVQTDDRLALEFSAPRDIYGRRETRNAEILRRVAASSPPPAAIAVTVTSATPAMWRDVGLMHLEAKAADAAYDALARAVERDPHDLRALAGLLRAAVAAGREERARALLEDLTRRDARNVPVRIALSRLLASEEQTDAALRAAIESLQIDPSSADAREQLASIFADVGDAARLDEVVQVMNRDAPDRPGTLYYRAVRHFLRGEFAEAVVIGERAAAADPSNARVQNLLGAAFGNLGRPDRARAAFETSVQADPRDPSALTNLGMFELESSNAGAAAARFAEALLLDPAFRPALAGLAEALDRQGERERAARVRRR
jgi:spermidine synthase